MSALIFTTLACAFPAPELNELQQEFAKFEGTWHLVRIDGQRKEQVPKEWPVPKTISIYQTAWSSFFFTGARAGFHIDPTQSPKHLDVVINQNLPIQKWIYSFDGDQLKLAVTFDPPPPEGVANDVRPKSFLITDDPTVLVFILKREKK